MRHLLMEINPSRPSVEQTPNRGLSYAAWCKNIVQAKHRLNDINRTLGSPSSSRIKAMEPPLTSMHTNIGPPNRNMEKLVEFWDHANVLSDLLQVPMKHLAELSPGLWHASIRQCRMFREQYMLMDPTTMTQNEMEQQKVVERNEMRQVLTELRETELRPLQEEADENAAMHQALPPESDGEEEPFEDVELP